MDMRELQDLEVAGNRVRVFRVLIWCPVHDDIDYTSTRCSQVFDPRNIPKRPAATERNKVGSINQAAVGDFALDHGQTLQLGGPNLGGLGYLTVLELYLFQTSAPRAELREGGVIQPDMDKL